jgi:hypothetical protein
MSNKKARRVRPLGVAGRSRGRLVNGLEIDVFKGPSPGPGVVVADPAAVLDALEGFDPGASWKKVRARVLPMLPRARPFPGRDLELVRSMLAPGILVNFGIDLGPAVTFVGRSLLERWKVDLGVLTNTALENLRAIAKLCDEADVLHDHIGDVPVTILQTRRGIAASLLLLPDMITRLMGPGPNLLIAPMRDLLVALPADVDREFASWLADEFEVLDPNHLHLGGFRHERGVVTPEVLEEALAQA